MKIIVVRHASTAKNEAHIIQGWSDEPLSEKGIREAEALAEELKNVPIGAMYYSDIKRAAQTAEIIAKHHNVPYIASALLRERDVGCLVGTPSADIDWDNLPPDVETNASIMARAEEFIRSISKKYANESILVVTHADIGKAIRLHLTGKTINKTELLKKWSNACFEELGYNG